MSRSSTILGKIDGQRKLQKKNLHLIGEGSFFC
nr:MAG TPA_asm: hypothetical protein [Caudoviricetes sp.]